MNARHIIGLVLFVVAAIASRANAQWLNNGYKLYYNSGNIGIGTSNPAYKMDVRTNTELRAVFGFNSATTGVTYGVFGQSNSTAGRGVFGLGDATTGVNYGVYGKTNSPEGFAGFFAGNVGVTGWIGRTTNAPLDLYSNGERVFRVEWAGNNVEASPNITGGFFANRVAGDVIGATIAGGGASDNINLVEADFATIGGGRAHTASGELSTIGGGRFNRTMGETSTVGGGYSNEAIGTAATIAGGEDNIVSGESGFIGGGGQNTCEDNFATVSGGLFNVASGESSSICGGDSNTAAGMFGMVCGGYLNAAAGGHSFAAGNQARANHLGSFVWGDSTPSSVSSSADNQMTFRSVGGVRIYTNTALNAGVSLAPGDGAWASVSDRNAKENFLPVDARDLLERLCSIPVMTWNYRSQSPPIRHIGPMAQDFFASFQVGSDDRHITTIDADGVALAAIQGLHQIVQEQQAEIRGLRQTHEDRNIQQQTEIESLRAEVQAMRALLANIAPPVAR